MNFKVAFFLFFIGAASASFLDNVNRHVGAKKSVEGLRSSFPLFGASQKATKDPISDLLEIVAQIIAEFELFGELITETLLEDLQNFLADLIAIESDLIEQVIAIFQDYIDLLPQEVIDILVELGLLPPQGKDAIDDLLNTLIQIVGEFQLFGEIISETLLEDLQNFLADLIAIESDLLDQVIAILQDYINLLPQEVIDILVELGLLPGAKLQVEASLLVTSLKATLFQKDIWEDLADQLMLQLVQILANLDAWGIEISDAVLAQIEDLILGVLAEGGAAWETLLALLEEYSLELNEVLGELLAEIGVLPKKVTLTRQNRDLIDDIFNALAQIIAEIEQFGEIVSQELIEIFSDLLLQLQEVGGVGFDLIIALLEQYAELLYEQFGDLLEQLGITVPPLVTVAAPKF